jgi:tetratricopeptide (TPR) repeat protein
VLFSSDTSDPRLAPYASALLLGAQGMALVVVGQTAEAEPLLARTLEIATTLGNARLRAYALLGLGGALANRSAGDACQRLDAAAEAFRGTGDWWGLAITLSTRGQLALAAGDHAAAKAIHEEALTAAGTVDNDYLRAQVLDMLGLDAFTAGDLTGARTRYSAAAALHSRLLDYEGSANCLSGLADLALGYHKPRVAARLIGASGYARQTVGAAVWPGMQSIDKARRAAVTTALNPASLAAAAAEGARMRIPDALGYGLTATAAQQTPDPFAAWASRLRPTA